MARLTETTVIYDAADRWKRDCLIADGSIFQAGAIWTIEHARDLIQHFVEKPDEGERTFEEKLRDQLAPAPTAATQLAAEMLWVMMLFPSNLKRATKINLVRTVWDWSGTPLRDPNRMLDVFERGIGSGGMGYNNYRPFELFLLIRFTEALKTLDASERESLLKDPWGFADWFDRLPNATSRQLRHMLLHLLFPDEFERISSRSDKKSVDRAFAGILQMQALDLKDRAPTALARDRRLWHLRHALEAERPGTWVDFYEVPEIRSRWRDANPPEKADAAQISEPSPTTPYLSKARVWAIGAGRGADRWPAFLEQGLVAIGWDELGDLGQYSTQDDIRAAIKRLFDREQDPTNDSLACYQFCHDIAVGDEVYVKQGRDRILGRGRIASEYQYDSSRPDFRNVRRVEWLQKGNWTLPETAYLPLKTLTDITQYQAVRDAVREQSGAGVPALAEPKPYGVEDILREAFLPRDTVEQILSSIRRRKNLIIQGSPGVGKSFLARRLAYALVGAESPDNVQMVQFHQSYAYEDFIQGWRPTGGGGFTLRNGVFHEFCRRAQSRPGEPHVFVIDEINRGNLSKVFGELLLLIESDKRGPEFAIPLTYAASVSDTFYVPDNVFVIGLMNTADRSLAMVDYALRRRFAFVTLEPAFANASFRRALVERGVDGAIIDRIIERVSEVNQRITSDHKNLGPGFAIGHSYFCPTSQVTDWPAWYAGVVREEIAPLLDEYWFDDRARVAECLKILSD